MKFSLRRPCPQCPFRSDIPPLRVSPAHASKVRDMVHGILNDNLTFACHQTNEYDEHGEGVDKGGTCFCAGAILMLEQLGKTHKDVEEAIGTGAFNPAQMDRTTPIYPSEEAMLKAALGEKPETRAEV